MGVHIEGILRRMPPEMREEYEKLDMEERALLLQVVSNPNIYNSLSSLDWKEEPVPAEKFFTDPYYFGAENLWDSKEQRGLFPVWYEELCYVLNPNNRIYEWILAGSLGTGKTTAAIAANVYLLYRMSCLRDPRGYLGVLASSTIEFFMFNITLAGAQESLVDRFENLVSSSPYFREKFPPDKRRRISGRGPGSVNAYKLTFPPFFSLAEGSGEQHFISRDILAGIMDEASFADRTKASKGRINYDEASRAFTMYTAILNRITSRFAESGHFLGLIILISSAGTHHSFLEQHKDRARDRPHTHVSEFAHYEVRPWQHERETFRVLVGDSQTNPRILSDHEEPSDLETGRVINVPVNLKPNYEHDISRALREFSGIPSSAVLLLFPDRRQLRTTVDARLRHPFIHQSPIIGHLTGTPLTRLIIPDLITRWDKQQLKPRFFPNAPRFAHVDLSKNICPTGIAMGCICGFDETLVDDNDGRSTTARVPKVFLDFTLQILPPPSPEAISYASIRELWIYLRDILGFKISLITYDGYQSEDSKQILQNQGFRSDLFSVDKNPKSHMAVRSAVMEERLIRYHYQPLEDEWGSLQKYEDGTKVIIDHPPGQNKDVADCVAAVVWHCTVAAMTSSDDEILGLVDRSFDYEDSFRLGRTEDNLLFLR